jgi:ribonuclease D
MSDALLERLAKSAEGILAHLQKSPVFGLPTAANSGGAKNPAPAGTAAAPDAAKAAADKAAAKAAADKKTAAAAAAAAAAKAAATPSATKPAGPPAGTRAPGGKHTIEQVREMIRKVAADKNLGKQSAKDILSDDGGGVEKVLDLKPENYDKVFEACEVLLNGEGNKEAAAPADEDDLM